MFLLDTSYWEIKSTKKKGRGVFAKKEIQPGVIIGDYIGKVIKTAQEDTSEKDGLYLLYYHDYAAIYPEDITATGVHLINHSCAPNCWIYIYKGHTLFFTLRKIFAGEELTISYLLYPKELCDEDCAHTCLCESKFCTDTMHLPEKQFKEWSTFQENQSNKTKRAPIRYGKLLPKLKNYPQKIEDHPIYTLFGSGKKEPKAMQNANLPSIQTLRNLIRSNGQKLYFPRLHKMIHGIQNNIAIE